MKFIPNKVVYVLLFYYLDPRTDLAKAFDSPHISQTFFANAVKEWCKRLSEPLLPNALVEELLIFLKEPGFQFILKLSGHHFSIFLSFLI